MADKAQQENALHDIGKIGIDEKILNKPGKLTKEEFEIMKTHTLIGAQMLDNLDMYRNEKLLKLAYEICHWHHERYDGKGIRTVAGDSWLVMKMTNIWTIRIIIMSLHSTPSAITTAILSLIFMPKSDLLSYV
jgi:hypothetical protein